MAPPPTPYKHSKAFFSSSNTTSSEEERDIYRNPMEYSPNNFLQRQKSCACPSLNIAGWCSSSRRRTAGDYSYDKLDCLGYNPPPAQSVTAGRLRWKGLWKRMVNKKRRIFDSSAHPAAANAPYDSYSYAQNFDEGSSWVEPENLSRSFSARFAASSGVLRRFG